MTSCRYTGGYDCNDDDKACAVCTGTGACTAGQDSAPTDTDTDPCTDTSGWCASYMDLGYCATSNKYHGFMKRTCQKACGFCTPEPTVGYVAPVCPTTTQTTTTTATTTTTTLTTVEWVPYSARANGSCEDGYGLIGTKGRCEAAAVYTQLTDITADAVSASDHPKGCFFTTNAAAAGAKIHTLVFNTYPLVPGTGVAYKLANVGNCAGTGDWIESKAACQAAAASLGLSGTTAGGNSIASNPYGCYYKKSTKALYWSLAGGKNDDDTDRVSVCAAAGECVPWPQPHRVARAFASHKHTRLCYPPR